MKQQWKILIPLMLSGGIVACASSPADKEVATKVEQPTNSQEANDSAKDSNTAKQDTVVLKATKTSDGKLILGSQEWVYVPGVKENFRARVDTGATTSSISAVDIEPFERDGKDWVKFRIEHDGIKSEELSVPVERWVHIRQATSEKTHRRPVIVSWIQIGDVKEQTEFTLADRTHLSYPLLLGRSFFKDVAVVDVGRKYVQEKHKKD